MVKASTFAENLEEELECAVCLEQFKDPKVLPCLHSFCKICLEGLVGRKGKGNAGKLNCTTCRITVEEHDGELLKLFCETCDEAICRDCAIVKHRDHQYTFVKDAFAKNKTGVVEILSRTKRQAGLLKKGIDGVLQMRRSVALNAEQTVQEVHNCFQKLSACLNARCEELIRDVEELKKMKEKTLEIQQGELEAALGSVQSSAEFTEKALENGSEVEILNMCKLMSSRLDELNSSKWQLEPHVLDVFKFLTEDQLLEKITNFGRVADHIRAYAKWDGRKREEGSDACEVEFHTQSGETAFGNSVKDIGNGTYSFYFTPTSNDYQMSVKLNANYVKDNPFKLLGKNWKLCLASNISKHKDQYTSINLNDDSMTEIFNRRVPNYMYGATTYNTTTPAQFPLTVFGTSQSQFELKKAKQKSLEVQQEDLESALCSVQSSVEFTEKALENGSEVEILNMRKKMSSRLEELNSAIWQLEPCAHDVFRFHADDQLYQVLASYGTITDICTDAGTSTVTMGHGLEGLMYNTIIRQPVEFTVTAKQKNGMNCQKGGDQCEVKICAGKGKNQFSDVAQFSAKDVGNGTYNFSFTPNQVDMKYRLSVKLNGFHVKGSSCTWHSESWQLCPDKNDMWGTYPLIQIDKDSRVATYVAFEKYDHEDYCEEPEYIQN
ncbi:tripartite motif-containing protein 45-like [Stylophora pistillata]|uniref:tripartite motif-containing protein 45-like n=1 Tax=Stylophora pistillata TaxID=50429 RepID=UPI000C03C77A|nr:tripartite motif-containing protein 45-like [Stylophora pistillata]